MKNSQFKKYLDNEFYPACAWAHSIQGGLYIQNNIPSLHALRPRENEVMAAVYLILINQKPIYIGQSLRTVKRLYVHAYHIAFDSYKYFGVKPEEIRSVDVKILTAPIFKESSRLEAEAGMVRKYKPALQPYSDIAGMSPDACMPRNARRSAMLEAGVI